jgi:hypothetical protein
MANLPESATWTAGVYQLETTDPVLGGAEGVDNVQAKALANRTAYLKSEIEALAAEVAALDFSVTNHGALTGRDTADAHPIEAITGLFSALAGRAPSVHQHSASAISAGTMDTARLPAASTSAAGIVQLVAGLTSTSNTQALAAGQGKALKDLIDQIAAPTTGMAGDGGWLIIPTPTTPMYVQWIAKPVKDGDWQSFPIEFPTACLVLVGIDITSTVNTYISVGATALSRLGFRVRATNLGTSPPTRWTHATFGGSYLALGH